MIKRCQMRIGKVGEGKHLVCYLFEGLYDAQRCFRGKGSIRCYLPIEYRSKG